MNAAGVCDVRADARFEVASAPEATQKEPRRRQTPYFSQGPAHWGVKNKAEALLFEQVEQGKGERSRVSALQRTLPQTGYGTAFVRGLD